MAWRISPPWTPAKVLTALLGTGLALAALSLVLLVSFKPSSDCTTDYANPPTPLHSGAIGIATLVFGAVALLISFGLKLGLPKDSPDRPWATRALILATLLLFVAGGAAAAVIARWTCFA
jgi:hypothetical protein